MSPEKQRLLLFIIATSFFVTGFVISVYYYSPVYSLNQKIVIQLQKDITSKFFIALMNIVSNIFNPILCAGYILILYLLTSRKLEVIAFLLWFLFLSWMISLLKQVFQQPRPFWISSEIKMLQWTCYTEYGNPSGHSALVIVLLDFLVRFGCRWSQKIKSMQGLLYVFVFFGEVVVMFSRMYLGMHSLNQVLFGFMIGAYSLVPYYLYIQKILFFFCIKFLREGKKVQNFLFMIFLAFCIGVQHVTLTYIPKFDPQNDLTNPWISSILSRSSCQSYKYATSFYLRCFQDQSIAFGIPALMISLSATHNGYSLLKKLSYRRFSCKFVAYLLTTIIVSLIPIAIFLNPLWKRINFEYLGVLLWLTHGIGISCGIVSLVGISPYFLRLFKLDDYQYQSYYNQYKITIKSPDGGQVVEMVNIQIPQSSGNDIQSI